MLGAAEGAISGYAGAGGFFDGSLVSNALTKVAAEAALGCLSGVAQGGKCGRSALSSAVAAATGPMTAGPDVVLDIVGNTVSGGFSTLAGGGKFLNGAATGAFNYAVSFAAGAAAQIGIEALNSLEQDLSRSASVQTDRVKLAFGDGIMDSVSDAGVCLKNCTIEHYDVGNFATRLGVGALSTPIPKSTFGIPTFRGSSSVTNLLSYFGFSFPSLDVKIGVNVLGTQRLFGIAGRVMPYVSGGLFLYDVGAIGTCTAGCIQSEQGKPQ